MRAETRKGLVEVTTYEVTVERAERYWRVYVPKVDRVTQARRLREVPVMARDLIEAMTDEPAGPDAVTLNIHIILPNPIQQHIDRHQQLRDAAAKAQAEAAAEYRAAARELAEDGLTYRDIGGAMGISHQRAEQLVKSG